MEANSIQKRINAFKRKYYFNSLLKGVLVSIGLLLAVYLFYIFLEYIFRWDFLFRAFLFYSYLFLIGFVFIRLIFIPVFKLIYKRFQLSDEYAAAKIGNYFPQVHDKLLNIIQLYALRMFDASLVEASINQKSNQIGLIRFAEAINLKSNVKYLAFVLAPFILVFLTSLVSPGLLKDNTKRIVYYSKDFPEPAPFRFILVNKNLSSFKNDDFEVKAQVVGSSIPREVFIVSGDKRLRVIPENSIYSYTFRDLIDNLHFHFEAAGYHSDNYELLVNSRPNIKNFSVLLSYPKYLNLKPEKFNNIGNFQIPEGTTANWDFEALSADSMFFLFKGDSSRILLKNEASQEFSVSKQFFTGDDYEIVLKNAYSYNKDKIQFHVDVIPDEYPLISLNQFQDTVLYQYLILGGNISDDHGFSDLKIFYRIIKNEEDVAFRDMDIPINPSETSQNFYFHWNLDSLKLNQSDQVEYFVQVRDNDGIKGPKASKTGIYRFKIPDRESMGEELAKSSQNTENQLDKNVETARQFKKQLEELDDRLKGKRELNWQDRKSIDELIKRKDSLVEKIKRLQEISQANTLKSTRFGSENEKIKEKAEQLQQLMNDLLDDDTKKMFDELNRLLDENKDLEQVKNLLDKIDFKEDNLVKSLERTIELFKRLKYESKLDEVKNQVDDLKKQQDSLSNATPNKNNDLNRISETQQKLNQEFQNSRKGLEEMLDLNQDLKSPFPVENTIDDEKNIQQQQQNSLDNLNNGNRGNAMQSQQQAAQGLQKLSNKLGTMQMSGEMSVVQENYDDLRGIIDNLLKLSFSQEDLMNEIRNINQSDPRYNELSQEQLNLEDEASIVQDSLLSLASRVVMISSFVTREVNEMKEYIDNSTEALKERKKSQATGLQQFAMKSMNDLALLLEDVMTSMQQQLASMMGFPMKSNQKGNSPLDLSDLQEKLNQQINDLKKSGKSGRGLSEELAKLAAEQERIRRMFEEEREKNEKKESGEGGSDDLIKKMEQTELDLVNKNITQQLLNRQKEIKTRLLESEKAMREQELDPNRIAERPKDVKYEVPQALEEYLKKKEKEVELLKTVPPKLNPYYKKEVTEYFKRLQSISQQ